MWQVRLDPVGLAVVVLLAVGYAQAGPAVPPRRGAVERGSQRLLVVGVLLLAVCTEGSLGFCGRVQAVVLLALLLVGTQRQRVHLTRALSDLHAVGPT